MRLSTKIFIGFGLVIFFSFFDSFVNYKLSEKVNTNTGFLTSSEAVIRFSNQLHKSIIEMQSGFRGFLLTENENFLQPYYEGLNEVPKLLKEEKALLKQQNFQLSQLDSIEFLHNKWIKYATTLIQAKKEAPTSPDAATLYKRLFENELKKEVGKKLNDRIKEIFATIDQQEYQLRQNRRINLAATTSDTRELSISLGILTLIIAIVSSLIITRNISNRINKMVNLAQQISRGQFTIIEDKRQDELTTLSESLNIMSVKLNKSFNELEKKNAELDQFAYVVSHDLKAPLRGMYNILEWIREDLPNQLSDELNQYLEKLRGRIIRLEGLVNGLLEYAKVGRVAGKVNVVDVKELVKDVCEMLVPVSLKVNISNNLPQIIGDKLIIEQVFTNLVSNAVKYNNKAQGEIEINYRDAGIYHEFIVKDNGVGISEKYFEKIFVLFQTLREKNESESTGIGLAIVKKIVEEQKGTIIVQSEVGKGSSFIFTLPKKL
jgi:signal transduction histidine kinase